MLRTRFGACDARRDGAGALPVFASVCATSRASPRLIWRGRLRAATKKGYRSFHFRGGEKIEFFKKISKNSIFGRNLINEVIRSLTRCRGDKFVPPRGPGPKFGLLVPFSHIRSEVSRIRWISAISGHLGRLCSQVTCVRPTCSVLWTLRLPGPHGRGRDPCGPP